MPDPFKHLTFEAVAGGDEDYDVIDQNIVVELTWGKDGWRIWNTVIADQRIGGTQHIGPGPFRDWLDEQRKALVAAATSPTEERP